MFVLQIQERGYDELQLGFEKLLAEFQDWRPHFELLEPESTTVIQRRFDQEGPGWLELTTKYAAWKSRHYPGKTILRRTDRGYLSFQTGSDGNITRIEPLSAEFGSDVEYLAFHQDTRPIIQISDQDEERFLQVVIADKTERIKEIGFDVN